MVSHASQDVPSIIYWKGAFQIKEVNEGVSE